MKTRPAQKFSNMQHTPKSREEIQDLLLKAAELAELRADNDLEHNQKLAWIIGWLTAQLAQEYSTNWELQARIKGIIQGDRR